MTAKEVATLRTVGFWEGISFLVLLFVAVPLKHAGDWPLAVSIVGPIHGVLFIWFCLVLNSVRVSHRWPLRRAVVVFLAGLLPFGPFLIDRRLQDEWAA